MTWTFLTVGIPAQNLPAHDDVVWREDASASYDAVVIDAEKYDRHRAGSLDTFSPLLPVVAVGLGPVNGADVVVPSLGSQAISKILQALSPIRARIAELPHRDYSANRNFMPLAIMALTFTRGLPIEAMRTPMSSSTIAYPLLEGRLGSHAIDVRASLESLASLELLNRRFSARILTCSHCESGRLSAYEACSACGGAHLLEESIVHHYQCGFQDAESRFAQGLKLICPKCQQELRHFGVDYGRPGTLFRCLGCQHVLAEPLPVFACLDCRATTPGDGVGIADWYDYELTERGETLLQSHSSGQLDMTVLTQSVMRSDSLKDFTLIAREQVMVANRYERPMMLTRIGVTATQETSHLVTQIIVENLRNTDAVTTISDDRLIIAMPETDRTQAEAWFDRVRRTVTAAVTTSIDLRFELFEKEDAIAILDALVS